LLQHHGLHTGKVTGKDAQIHAQALATTSRSCSRCFARARRRRRRAARRAGIEIDLLIGTDCISEGQNLQDCDYLINYDIHWNPVRIIQRFGRVDRIGSPNASIQLVNYWPDISLDEYINLKERVENRMMIADVTATGDDNVLTAQANDVPTARSSCAACRKKSSSWKTSRPASPSPTWASTTSAWTC
jgi:superfamily II DNA/RNA helicase